MNQPLHFRETTKYESDEKAARRAGSHAQTPGRGRSWRTGASSVFRFCGAKLRFDRLQIRSWRNIKNTDGEGNKGFSVLQSYSHQNSLALAGGRTHGPRDRTGGPGINPLHVGNWLLTKVPKHTVKKRLFLEALGKLNSHIRN